MPAAVRAWSAGDTGPGRKVWATLADLGVTALAVPEEFDGIERPSGRPGGGRRAPRATGVCPARSPNPSPSHRSCSPTTSGRAALASGELIATVAMPPHVPRAVDADFAGLILVADDDGVRDGDRGRRARVRRPRPDAVRRHRHPVRPEPADTARAFEFGALVTAAQLVGAGQAMLDASVAYAKQRSQFGRVIGSYQAIKHKLADVHIAVELARPLVYGAALSLADGSPDTARDVSAAKAAAVGCRAAVGALVAADPRRDRLHPGARPVPAAAAGAGAALGVGRPDVAPPPGTGGAVSEDGA